MVDLVILHYDQLVINIFNFIFKASYYFIYNYFILIWMVIILSFWTILFLIWALYLNLIRHDIKNKLFYLMIRSQYLTNLISKKMKMNEFFYIYIYFDYLFIVYFLYNFIISTKLFDHYFNFIIFMLVGFSQQDLISWN